MTSVTWYRKKKESIYDRRFSLRNIINTDVSLFEEVLDIYLRYSFEAMSVRGLDVICFR